MEKQRLNKRREKNEKTNQSVKIVIRHLPPTMTESDFLEQVAPLPENDSYYFCPADWSLGQEATCRAYIEMSVKDLSEVLQFRDRFDGYVFVDSKGVEYIAIVEYAPFQCFLKNKARSHDNKVNTIEKEPHYLQFLQKLADEREEASRLGDVKIDFTFDNKSDEKVKSTPLLEYLANKKEKRREEARKRNEEARKRNEEKRKLREDHKLQKAVSSEQPENAKAKETASANKKAANNAKKAFNKEGSVPEDGPKNSRSKRRTQRDQRRREELEQRKMGQNRETREKKKTDRPDSKDASQKSAKSAGAIKDNQKCNKDIVILKKKSLTDSNSDSVNALAAAYTNACQDASTKSEIGNDKVNAKDVSTAIPTLPGQNPSTSKKKNTFSSENYKTNSSRSIEERRIRNKDRPSIAIYQPKVRTNMGTDEVSPNCKDSSRATDPPTFPFDGDVSMADEGSKNKRFGRRNKQKHQEKEKSEQV